tara:strand:- start:446 stop:1228 length:783 start_codon:yes stop_codon:yes gene_type:complete
MEIMEINEMYIPESAMAIMAHPDDIEFACAGTLARWAKLNTRICYLVCTSGDAGIARSGMTRQEASQIRENEQRTAANIVGTKDVVFLREPDGMLQPTMEVRKKIVREIRRFRPEVIFCGDPNLVWAGETYINHPDHRAAATAAVDAIFPAAGQPNMFEELSQENLSAFKPRKVFTSGLLDDNQTVLSIDDTINIKIKALLAHESQFKGKDPSDYVFERAKAVAEGHNMKYGESFKITTLENDEMWEKYHGDAIDRHPGA